MPATQVNSQLRYLETFNADTIRRAQEKAAFQTLTRDELIVQVRAVIVFDRGRMPKRDALLVLQVQLRQSTIQGGERREIEPLIEAESTSLLRDGRTRADQQAYLAQLAEGQREAMAAERPARVHAEAERQAQAPEEAAELARKQADLEQRYRERLERDKAAEAAKQQAEAEAERWAKLSPDLRAFIEATPGYRKTGNTLSKATTALTVLYSGELSLRVCRERWGVYADEIKVLQQRIGLTERALVEWQGVDPQSIAKLRDALGVDSGRGELVSHMRANPQLYLASRQTVAMQALGGPLVR
jgi:hypothetical protein